MKNLKQPIVVLGMHRSGTSAIARALKVLGVNLGERLMEARYDNPTGFWEDLDIHDFHRKLFESLEIRWNRLAVLSHDEFMHLKKTGMHAKASEIMLNKLKNINVFGMKHPRMAKIFPFWKAVFDEIGCRPKYIIAVRNPLSVARSLYVRNGIGKEYACLMWIGHVLPSLEAPANSSVIVNYDSLMENPERELFRIASRFDLDINDAELRHYLEKFLKKELRNTSHNLADLEADTEIHPLVTEVYRAMLELADDKKNLSDPDFIESVNRWKRQFSELTTLLNFIEKITYQKTELSFSLKYATEELSWKNDSISWKCTKPMRSTLSLFQKLMRSINQSR